MTFHPIAFRIHIVVAESALACAQSFAHDASTANITTACTLLEASIEDATLALQYLKDVIASARRSLTTLQDEPQGVHHNLRIN